ncbi:MAG: tRNA (cytidine(34)-2'-O)-methyltransferase [Lachnospiraceae bacterium]|nr:tRNA (cytidine(34)-2'-O)-methyltransferase [Lachnospiraceae bacterium]
MSIEIVLLQPEQPGNAGAIGRTCLCAGAHLHMIRPFGFHTDEKSVRRAGLDYWPRLAPKEYVSYDAFLAAHPGARIWYLTTKAPRTIADVSYADGDFLMFGRESAGIPEEILAAHPDRCVRIPMAPGERSLNLASSVSIALYEALRQLGYPGLESEGHLHRLAWQEPAGGDA